MNNLSQNALINFKGELYVVNRVIRESLKPIVDKWKEYLRCSTVLKNNGFYYFCEHIPEAELVEEQDLKLENQIKEENEVQTSDCQ